MRSRRLSFWCVVACACVMTPVVASATEGQNVDAGICGAVTEDGPVALPDSVLGTSAPVPLSRDVQVHRVTIVGGPGGGTVIDNGTVSGMESLCQETAGAAYCNTLSNMVFGPEDANASFADDIALAAIPDCLLDRFVIRVTGDKRQNGTGVGPYRIDFALYRACPGAGAAVPILGTLDHYDVPAEQAGDIVEITYVPFYVVNIPNNLYLGVSFDRTECGVVIGAPAVLGYSADRIDFPGFPCAAGLGGFPVAPHASFYAEIYTREECDAAFPGYKNTNHAGNAYSAGSRVYFADDIRLAVDECNMVGYEVAHKGTGFFRVQLHSFLSNSNPGSDGLIPGTKTDCFSSGSNVQICRSELEAPVLLPSQLNAVFRSSSASVGPVLTCKPASPGQTENLYLVYSGGEWVVSVFGGQCWAGFDLTIFCEGQPPLGACCDMLLTDEEGESVCRDNVALMNCVSPPNAALPLWREGEECASICDGGTNNGQPCTRQADCPGGECPGPFAHPCGQAACCAPDDDCYNLTENECDAFPPVESPRLYQRGEFCNEYGQRCPFIACLGREGECTLARPAWCVGGEDDGDACDPWAQPPGDCPGYSCVGGMHEGDPCDQDIDCPGGSCDDGECYGGNNDGEPCDVNRECIPGECIKAQCVGEVGCEDPFCCTDVCSDPYNYMCCSFWWDGQCASEAFRLCDRSPSGDECSDPEELRGSKLVEVPSTSDSDGIHATVGLTDSGFCCYEGDPGERGIGTIWYKFVAPPNGRCEGGDRDGQFCDPNAADPENPVDGCPAGSCLSLPISVSLDTCCSDARTIEGILYPADDSLLQVFALKDPDRGVCGDGLTECSISAQDCVGSECVFDEVWGCANLLPIACSDDAGLGCVCGPTTRPNNSRICVPDLTPGETYYVMVGAKTPENNGVWKLRVYSPCSAPDPSLENDFCYRATQLAGEHVEVPFDLDPPDYAPATFDCPGPPSTCLTTMENDIWYEWTAPCDGEATFQTCGFDPDSGEASDEFTPDTSMVVYDGCDCPVPAGTDPGGVAARLICSDFSPTPCFLGSKGTTDVVEGQCYKVRLGGRLGDTPIGENPGLQIDVECVSCPPGPVDFLDPDEDTVDARQPHPPADAGDRQGLDTFLVAAPAGAADNWEACWSLCETAVDGSANFITGVVDNGNGTFTVNLDRSISIRMGTPTMGAVTTITYTDDDETAHRGVFYSHPGNVNADTQSAPTDILKVIDYINGADTSPWGIYSEDVDQSGVLAPPDILRVIDLLNGAGDFDPWLNVPKPECGDCCLP